MPTQPSDASNYEPILQQAEQIIQKRFLIPYQEKLNQLLGDRGSGIQNNSNSSNPSTSTLSSTLPPLKLIVNWTSVRDLIREYPVNGLSIAENAIQILQEPSLYENMRKGVMRYISEDKLQRTIFNDQVDVICIDFFAGGLLRREEKGTEEETLGEETMVGLSDEKEGHLLYMINASTQEILASNTFYEHIEESFDELLETHQQILDKQSTSSTSSNGTSGGNGNINGSGNSIANSKQNPSSQSMKNMPIHGNLGSAATKSSPQLTQQLNRGGSVILSSSPNAQQRSALSRQTFMASPNSTTSPISPNDSSTTANVTAAKTTPLRRMSYVYDPKHLDDDDLIGSSNSMSHINPDTLANDSDLDKIEQLRRVCLHPQVWEKRDVSKLIRILQNEDLRYWKPNSEQSTMIEKSVEQLEARFKKFSSNEKIVKAWMITKINRKSLKQERVFVLTDSKFYTMKFSKDIDEKHIKMYPLSAVAMMDCARFLPNKDKKKKPYGLAVYMDEEKVSSGSKVVDGGVGDADEQHAPYLSQEDKKKKKNLSQKVMGKLRKEKTLQTNYDDSLDDDGDGSSLDSVRRGTVVEEISLEEKSQSRPDTNNLVAQYFMACNTVHQSEDQREFLMEIAWSVFACCSALKGKKQLVPFTQLQIKRPKKDLVGTYLYNKLSIGMKK